MKFDYDPKKSLSNKAKHGISFEEVQVLWSLLAVEIQARTLDEPRFMIIGEYNKKFYSCIFTKRGESIRLISARRSRKKEVAIYHERIRRE